MARNPLPKHRALPVGRGFLAVFAARNDTPGKRYAFALLRTTTSSGKRISVSEMLDSSSAMS